MKKAKDSTVRQANKVIPKQLSAESLLKKTKQNCCQSSGGRYSSDVGSGCTGDLIKVIGIEKSTFRLAAAVIPDTLSVQQKHN